MTQIEEWAVPAVLDELRRATEIGERLSRSQLQGTVGIGAGDLERVLGELRSKGAAREVAPDEYEAVTRAERHEDAEEPLGEETADDGGDGLPPLRDRLAERRRERQAVNMGGGETVLSLAMVEALDDGALGAIVRAGAVAADGGFVLRIVP